MVDKSVGLKFRLLLGTGVGFILSRNRKEKYGVGVRSVRVQDD